MRICGKIICWMWDFPRDERMWKFDERKNYKIDCSIACNCQLFLISSTVQKAKKKENFLLNLRKEKYFSQDILLKCIRVKRTSRTDDKIKISRHFIKKSTGSKCLQLLVSKSKKRVKNKKKSAIWEILYLIDIELTLKTFYSAKKWKEKYIIIIFV